MIKIAICDDNNSVCSEIEQYLLNYKKQLSVELEIEVFYNGEKLLEYIQDNHGFDLIFLDIELGTMTGVEVGTVIRTEFDDYISHIVFITSTQGYELQLFDLQPLNFIQKPIDTAMLKKCMDLVIKLMQIDNQTFEYKKSYNVIKIPVRNILYFEKCRRKIKIVTHENRDFFNETMSSLKKRLAPNFVESHESFVVNFNKIIALKKDEIIMVDGTHIPVSRARLKEMREMLFNTMEG